MDEKQLQALYEQLRSEGHTMSLDELRAHVGGQGSTSASPTQPANRFASLARPKPSAPRLGVDYDIDARTGQQIPRGTAGQGLREAGQFARLVAHDAPFMLGDEIIGTVRSGLTPGMTRGEGIEAERAAVKDAPGGIKALAAATSAILPAGLLTKLAKGGNRFARLRKLATGATAGGAAAGAGAAEGSPVERIPGAAVGAAFGAGTAGVLGAAGYAGRKFLDVAGRPSAAPTAGRFSRLARGAGVQTAEERELAQYKRGLEQAGKTTADVSAAGRSPKPIMAMDVGEDITLGQARGARTMPGPGKVEIPRALHERAAGAEERVITDLLETTGTGARTNTVRRAAERLKERAKNAQPLYEAAHSVEVKDDRLRKFFKIDEFQEAYREAQDLARLEGMDIPPLETLISEGGAVPVRSVDYAKRALDDMIERLSSGPANRRSKAKVLRRLKNEMLDVTDDLVPEFAEARAYFKGETELNEALESGRDLFKKQAHPDEIAEYLSNPRLSPAEREEFRIGALESVMDRIENKAPGANPERGVTEKTLEQKRLRQLFDSEKAYNDFRERIGEEVRMHRGKLFVTGGSNTVDKAMEVADMFDIFDLIPTPSQATPTGLLTMAIQKANQASNQLPGVRQRAAAMSSIATRSGPELERLARELEAAGEAAAARAIRARVGRTAAGIATGAAASRATQY